MAALSGVFEEQADSKVSTIPIPVAVMKFL
jgi:hypothetical protein